MGRGRGKGKKVNHHEDLGSGGEEKKQQPVRKRGRPVKPAKEEDDEIENVNTNKVAEGLEDGGDNAKGDTTISGGDTGNVGPDDLKRVPVVGYRHNGSRRKNKPRRAAEVGVECG